MAPAAFESPWQYPQSITFLEFCYSPRLEAAEYDVPPSACLLYTSEITPGNFTFRTREFEQMELEFFCKPDTDLEWFEYWRGFCRDWLINLGMKEENMRLRDHEKEELSFYSKATTDIEFLFPFGWGELWGIADRTDYDLGRHQEHSGKDLTYFDPEDVYKRQVHRWSAAGFWSVRCGRLHQPSFEEQRTWSRHSGFTSTACEINFLRF